MKTEIIVVADDSGSMFSLKDDANGAFDNFIAEQRLVDGEARVTLVKFATYVQMVYQGYDLKLDIPPLGLKPSGNTALYDALGMTINLQRDRIQKEGWADLVIFVVSTDGQENASKEYTLEGVKGLISMAEASGWKFIWLMSNQDAMTSARMMGSASGMTLNKAVSSQGERDSYSYASAQTRSLRSGDHK